MKFTPQHIFSFLFALIFLSSGSFVNAQVEVSSEEKIPLVPVYCGPEWGVSNIDKHISYWIAKNNVTVEQYTRFLNAVAATDAYQLYDQRMSCLAKDYKIIRSGISGHYTYAATYDTPLTSITFVDLYCALRFCNWLQNGQPIGNQDETTTERGAYILDGATATHSGFFTMNENGAKWFIPTLDQWLQVSLDVLGDNMSLWSDTIISPLYFLSSTWRAYSIQKRTLFGSYGLSIFANTKDRILGFRVAAPVANEFLRH
ncbi:MAG: hypothetical protein A3F67_00990 [Verrucomicrobia bacterium RIFCSPHIGHO2_12_FULL_41_10]|nr:MAG: hypothetical protein A3F67_00990 [Verrucomicrobia bacterium RIFCSPHIGHO2_12_FULL_41_10]HLB33111.1 hypothetical protein [Chthoniobacterales bacterium]